MPIDGQVPPETEFSQSALPVVDGRALDRVRAAAQASPRRRARLCLHAHADESLHDMVIVLLQGTVVAIHKHPAKAECFHVVSGRLTVVIHDDHGEAIQRLPLGPQGGDRPFLCRIAANVWHSVEVETEEAVVHESTTGPFSAESTVTWSRM